MSAAGCRPFSAAPSQVAAVSLNCDKSLKSRVSIKGKKIATKLLSFVETKQPLPRGIFEKSKWLCLPFFRDLLAGRLWSVLRRLQPSEQLALDSFLQFVFELLNKWLWCKPEYVVFVFATTTMQGVLKCSLDSLDFGNLVYIVAELSYCTSIEFAPRSIGMYLCTVKGVLLLSLCLRCASVERLSFASFLPSSRSRVPLLLGQEDDQVVRRLGLGLG